jgi:hypothetical protein
MRSQAQTAGAGDIGSTFSGRDGAPEVEAE